MEAEIPSSKFDEARPATPMPTIGKDNPAVIDDGNTSESNHCRICRGEGTAEDPLFYPCKCNGSIRFVHQGCLMQWLSHSQKKQCELCKTPFRFTKLYDPNMPSVVPWSIFLRQASIHALHFTYKCARWVLVLFVWLGWVPWCIRTVWRGLFWIGDGSWITQQQLDRYSKVANSSMITAGLQNVFSGRASVASNLGSTSLGNSSQLYNGSWHEPTLVSFGRWLLNTIILPYSVLANSTVEVKWVEGPPRRPSLLSDIKILKQPTRWKFVNDALLDGLEGQLITLAILVTFILMFLIREWVVQQQPMINLGAALDNEAALQQVQALAEPVPAPVPAPAQPADTDNIVQDVAHPVPTGNAPTSVQEEASITSYHTIQENLDASTEKEEKESAPVSPLTPQSESGGTLEPNLQPENPSGEALSPQKMPVTVSPLTPPVSVIEVQEQQMADRVSIMANAIGISTSPTIPTRPSMPSKEAASQAPDIARSLEERSQDSIEVGPSVSRTGVADDKASPEPNLEANATADGLTTPSCPSEETQDPATTVQTQHTANVVDVSSGDTRPQSSTQIEKPNDNGITFNIAEWMWGNIPDRNTQSDGSSGSSITTTNPEIVEEEADATDEDGAGAAIDDMANPGPNEPVLEEPALNDAPADADAPEAPVAEDFNDAEPVEDGEDMDDMLELIGMQGPLAGLLQNGMFSTVIISMTVLWGIWLPYILGKMMLVVIANPISFLVKIPLRLISVLADLVVDSFIFFSGCAYYWLDKVVRLTASPLSWILPVVKKASLDDRISKTAYKLTWSAADRLGKNLSLSGGFFSNSDIPVFSIIAHESLRSIEDTIHQATFWIFQSAQAVIDNFPTKNNLLSQIGRLGKNSISVAVTLISHAASFVVGNFKNFQPSLDMLKISLEIPRRTQPLQLSRWSANDRMLAIGLGYAFLASLGFFYLKLRKLFKNVQRTDKPADGLLVDVLNQAGGVFKVVLIITIEMLLFPLYCGFLLDAALLPLFSNATPYSRAAFLAESPWTSVFIHWFTGTCYMFHFALFVAMCRKILRPGVLYFIRDPDDPTFHPVRDVLERNVTTQLRKILFSALVYGALVIICLGAVVWSIAKMVDGIFPIHWSSNEPVLEFPADLLVYNFLIPVAVRILKPSTVLQDVYNWWFRKCARFLRMSHFLFGERNEDEEGYVLWQKIEGEEDEEKIPARRDFTWPVIRHHRLSWQTHSTKAVNKSTKASASSQSTSEGDTPPAGYTKVFVNNGRWVRAPASDQVRISKGNKTFVDIDPETGDRKDGLKDNPTGLHGKENKMFSDIYVPPYFRFRVAGFIGLIWAFAAVTGVGFTVVPLLVGRFIFARLIQVHPRTNDVYAFAIGFYLLGGPLWLIVKHRLSIMRTAQQLVSGIVLSKDSAILYLSKAFTVFLQFLRALYFYGTLMVLVPSLVGLTWEAYILVPLHTYFQRDELAVPQHTVHFVSAWTLGVLFVRVAVHVMLKYPRSQPTKALLALVSSQNRGSSWLDPDIKLATRAFVIPLTTLLLVALILPLGLGRLFISYVSTGLNQQTIIYRYSYPFVMALILAYLFFRFLRHSIEKWRLRVRDEVYLVKERLHNFDDKKPISAS